MTCTVHFVYEAGAQSGMGHYRRSRTLAMAFHERGLQVAMSCPSAEGLALETEFPVSVPEAMVVRPGDIIVADGYGFGAEMFHRWRSQGATSVLIDDLAERPLPADIVVNHNLYGDGLDYSAYGAACVLGGRRWCLIDPAFARLADQPRRAPGGILIGFGGGATALIGIEAAQGLAGRTTLPIHVALGTQATDFSHDGIQLHARADMVALMTQCTVYLGALGVSYLEASAAGMHAVGVQVVDNQARAAHAARATGQPVFERSEIDAAVTAALERSNRPMSSERLIDGQGSGRLARQILCFVGAEAASQR